ncbi:MAG TPA: HAMP domain-containing sensor histidine kinase, partial [Myxococcota bacterium]|nr:HAMP domain-containing sensor histidine kinase [Myxococcota bacterium]
VARATRRIGALSALLQDLLALGAMKGQLPERRPEPVDLARIVDRVRERVQPDVEAKGLALTLDLASEPLVVSANPDDVERLVGNLLENAVKYTPGGGAVRVTLARDGDQARMDFADTGIGIAPDALPHVFDEFYRAGNAKQQSEGTGLGLTLVRRIVDLLHGTIAVESTLGQGTTFTLRLPLAGANPDHANP